jgi:hypothetical protein
MKLTVNPDKTASILFTHKTKIGSHQNLKLFGKHLTLANETKYLGLKLVYYLRPETRSILLT